MRSFGIKSTQPRRKPRPPRPPPYVEQTPYSCSTSMISNSHERRDDIDPVLKEELSSIYTDVPGFEEALFGGVKDLEKAGTAVFHRFIEGMILLQGNSWLA
ncbi:hypothetical protein BDV33DRAFT_49016 [Aspergillus novoparasiticus]|uniref:Uncharacterized protein n=1 Tax=Aspergillus novoparasiticus TaxID=986946 RepID=A0A5N6E8T0_9EURO|nr:hypothetical protein BDV33DRAFT_49016 [Aspergillus novoparasiticus]